MAAHLSNRTISILLCLLTAVSWGLAFAQWAAGFAEPTLIASSVMFTAMLVAYPFLTGTRLASQHADAPCTQCGALPPDVAFVRFCIYCGAFPKASSRAAANGAAAATNQ